MNDTKVKVSDEHLFSSSMSPGYKETNYCKKKKKKNAFKAVASFKGSTQAEGTLHAILSKRIANE